MKALIVEESIEPWSWKKKTSLWQYYQRCWGRLVPISFPYTVKLYLLICQLCYFSFALSVIWNMSFDRFQVPRAERCLMALCAEGQAGHVSEAWTNRQTAGKTAYTPVHKHHATKTLLNLSKDTSGLNKKDLVGAVIGPVVHIFTCPANISLAVLQVWFKKSHFSTYILVLYIYIPL